MTEAQSNLESTPISRIRHILSGGGFTLSNLVYTMGLGGMVLTVLSSYFAPSRQSAAEVEQVAEVDQGVRAALAMLSQEIDQAGACLPAGGTFIAMQTADQQDADSLTVRVGRVDPAAAACVRSALASRAASGDRHIEVESNEAFRVGDRILIAGLEDGGEVHTITLLAGSSRIGIDPAVEDNWPNSASVFALEERHYAIDRTGGRPVLTVQVNGEKRLSLVDGLTSLDLTYRLADGSEVSASPDGRSEWRSVREISLAVAAESRLPGSDGRLMQRAGVATARPRHSL